MEPAEAAPSETPRSSAARVAGFVIGLALLVAAVLAVSTRTDALGQAVVSAGNASPWLVLAVLALPLLNIAVISCSFWVLTSRFGRVTLREMVALILSSWLLNHLPMRPGLVGRVGYHRVVNRIPIRASLRVIVEQLLCGVLALGLMLLFVFVAAPLGRTAVVASLLGAGLLTTATGFALRSREAGGRQAAMPCLVAAVGLRLLDMTIWIVRYTCLFALVGFNLNLQNAAAVTAASQAAMLSPIPLGLREWVVGLVHGMMGGEWKTDGGFALASVAPGVAADLANRAAELLVAVPLGVAATIWLMRRYRDQRSGGEGQPHPMPTSSV